MKKLFLLFFATAAMTLVSCGGSSSDGSESASESSVLNVPERVQAIDNNFSVDTTSVAVPDTAFVPETGVAQETASEPATCSKCGGSGKVKCSKCKGKGTYFVAVDAGMGGWFVGCKKCGGRGDDCRGINGEFRNNIKKGSGKMKCPKCHGSGKV